MAGSLNRAELIGNVGGDPTIRDAGGNKVASFSLATSESWADKRTGEKREVTEWHNVVVWGDGLVGVIEKYVRKGSKIFVEGRLKTRKWTDPKTNQDRYTTEVVVQMGGRILLLDGKQSGNQSRPQQDESDHQEGASSRGGHSDRADNQDNFDKTYDDEVPF